MSLTFTGERFLPECQGEMVYEHWHRYLLAREYAAGKRVLDIPSGEGYGSHLLAGVAESVVGIDVATDAVAHASEKYRKDNLQYLCASGTDVPLADASFDLIVSFEMIEHIHEQEAFLREVNRLLKPDGLFIISSPNRVEYTEKTGYKNEFHVKELDKEELKQQLSTHWPCLFWAGQRAAFHSIVWPIDADAQSAGALDVEGESAFPNAMYFLVFCSKSHAVIESVTPSLTLVADKNNSVYAEWSRTYRENDALRAEVLSLREKDKARNTETVTAITLHAATPPATSHSEHWLVRFARRLVD